jgi:hypothetical protein
MHGTTVPLDTAKQQSMARLEALARLMDGAIVLPALQPLSDSMASSD